VKRKFYPPDSVSNASQRPSELYHNSSEIPLSRYLRYLKFRISGRCHEVWKLTIL